MQRSLTDTTKVIAAIAVIGIHATSRAEIHFAQAQNFFSLDFLGVVVNQWARFSVPLFIYLSGYGLALADRSQVAGAEITLTRYAGFLRHRLPVILVPYLFFSGVAFAMAGSLAQDFHSCGGEAQSLWAAFFHSCGNFPLLWKSIAGRLLTGSADYHLYFLVILTQCYLLFPLLSALAHRSIRVFRYLTWLLFFAVTALLYKGSSELLLPALGWAHPGWHASVVIYWLAYFMLGILHAQNPPRPWPRSLAALSAGMAFVLVLAEYVHYSRQSTPVDYYNHFSRPSVLLYALAVIAGLHAWGRGAALGSGVPQWWSTTARWASLTFAVYLLHPQVLRLTDTVLVSAPAILTWVVVTLTSFALVYCLGLTTAVIARYTPVLASLIQRCLGLR